MDAMAALMMVIKKQFSENNCIMFHDVISEVLYKVST